MFLDNKRKQARLNRRGSSANWNDQSEFQTPLEAGSYIDGTPNYQSRRVTNLDQIKIAQFSPHEKMMKRFQGEDYFVGNPNRTLINAIPSDEPNYLIQLKTIFAKNNNQTVGLLNYKSDYPGIDESDHEDSDNGRLDTSYLETYR